MALVGVTPWESSGAYELERRGLLRSLVFFHMRFAEFPLSETP